MNTVRGGLPSTPSSVRTFSNSASDSQKKGYISMGNEMGEGGGGVTFYPFIGAYVL